MTPVFPTKTFPNHYTQVTGLYPAHHGIIGNTMHDPEWEERFSLRNQEIVREGRWWEGEPLWVTLEKQGIPTAPLFWPGSEAPIQGVRPSHWLTYDSSIPVRERIHWIMQRLRLPVAERPRFLTLYLPLVDAVGHRYGPHAPEIKNAVHRVDRYFSMLMDSLETAEMAQDIHIVITSDHGMAESSRERVLLLDDYVDMKHVARFYGDPILMVHPARGKADILFAALQKMPHVRFFHRKDVPEVFHFRGHRRIAPIVGIAEEGWRISTHRHFDANPAVFDGGTHGYDHRLPSMQGIFIGHGPAFRKGVVSESFSIIHVYALLTHLLEITPAPHDGDLQAVSHLLITH